MGEVIWGRGRVLGERNTVYTLYDPPPQPNPPTGSDVKMR